MTKPHSQAPTRLLDDASIDEVLRRDLELVHSQPPIAYDLASGLSRFETTLIAGATIPKASGVGLRLLGWVIGASVLLGGLVGTAQVLAQDEAPRLSSAVSPRIDIEPEDKLVAGPSSSVPSAPVAEVEVSTSVGSAPGGTPEIDDEPTPPRPVAKPELDEATHMNEARKALTGDPAKTLALVEAAEQHFPDGAMIQERRGYAILALVALGRSDEANSRADAYLEQWPNGTLARRVRDALGR